MAMPAPVLAILDEHKYMERLLALLDDQVQQMARGKEPDFDTVRSIMRYMVEIPDRFHHPKEDLIFARMSKHDARVKQAIARLMRGHKAIDEHGARLLQQIDAADLSPSRSALRELQHGAHDYVRGMREHMRLEEDTVFLPAIAELSAADWRAVDEAMRPVADPVFGEEVAARYLPLFGSYLNQVSRIATGQVPFLLVENVATRAEYSYFRLRRLLGLPGRLYDEAREGLQRRSAPPGGEAGPEPSRTSRESLQRICGILREGIRPSRSDPNAKAPPPEDLPPRDPDAVMRYGERELVQRRDARISWQAAMMNLAFRFTMKPMMASIRMDRVSEMSRHSQKFDRAPKDCSVTPVDTQEFRAEWLQPDAVPSRRTVLLLPGGGFIFPASAGHKTMLADVCRQVKAQGMLVHYRLVPEHPFPAGLEDAIAAYRYLLAQGTPAREIALIGDSAGGGLALALLLSLRDQGIPLPACLVLLSPLTDLGFSTPARQYNRWRDPMLPTRRKLGGYAAYSGETPFDNPLVSPIYGDYRGFPPIFAQVSSTETLLDDTRRVARKARAQGIEFETEVWDGMPHDWSIFNMIPEAAQAREHVAAFIRRHLGDASSAKPKRVRARKRA